MNLSFWFFKQVDLASEYQKIDFFHNANLTRLINILLVSDSDSEIQFSWDGTKLSGILKKKEILEISEVKRNKIYVKGFNSMRIWVSDP